MMNVADNALKIKHLYNRAGFGISYEELQNLSKKSYKTVVKEMFIEARRSDDLKTVDDTETRNQMMMQAGLYKKKNQLTEAEKQQRKEIIRQQNNKSRELNIHFVEKMINSKASLREKMTLFWHGHFACRSRVPLYAQQLNNIQRDKGLGDFKTLLMQVSQSPAMLAYLNNQQNRKGHPNENFARELMELFTIGRGNYTEQDVKESARSFTGWTYDKDGEFLFRKNLHDEEAKTFFGKKGNFDGESIIDALLENPKTAEFISKKAYRFFVNDTPNETHVKELASHFYNSKYNIADLMEKIFLSDWFFSKENIGNKIKSPAELIVGLSRQFYVTYNKPQVLLQLQSSLGQYLFNPPNVAGWPGGQSWIDSSSLMLRMRIPSLVLDDGLIDFSGKADPEEEAVIALNQTIKQKVVKSYINASANWPEFFKTLPEDISPTDLASFLLQPTLSDKLQAMISQNKSLKNTVVEITSTPEYQLC